MSPYDLDLACWPIFRRMTDRGLCVDVSQLICVQTGVRLSLELLRDQLPPEIHPSSSATVAAWMEANGFGKGKRTPGGALCTDERTLTVYNNPVLNKVLEYRKEAKLLNTFIDPTITMAMNQDSVIHPKWKLTRVRSGRVACEDPNLMAFPARTEGGKAIRRCFVARSGFIFVSVDFSQIEPRVVAALSQDPKLLTIYKEGRDLYQETADALGIPRHAAKIVTLGVLYGMSAKRLREQLALVDLSMTEEDCQQLIYDWFSTYPSVHRLVLEECRKARENDGWAYTEGGRGRRLPGLYLDRHSWPGSKMRPEAERQCFNHLIQGTAQECMKRAMVEVCRDPSCYSLFWPLLQIHDEVVFECSLDYPADHWAQVLSTRMRSTWCEIMLETTASHSDNWGDLK